MTKIPQNALLLASLRSAKYLALVENDGQKRCADFAGCCNKTRYSFFAETWHKS